MQLGLPIPGAAKTVIRTGLCFCGCCPDEQHSHSGPSLTAKTDLHLMDAMSGRGKHMGNQMVCTALLIFCAHLCSSHRWLIANCLVSFSVIKFSLSPMPTTLGSSSPVVQTGESSSGTWMLRGRR